MFLDFVYLADGETERATFSQVNTYVHLRMLFATLICNASHPLHDLFFSQNLLYKYCRTFLI
jgi:hypothetical protein